MFDSCFIRWWTDLGFKEKLSFSRDRLVENYLWAMGFTPEPHFSKCRIGLTKFICIFSAMDDMYDIYGSPDELRRFTDAVNRYETYNMIIYREILFTPNFFLSTPHITHTHVFTPSL